MEVTMPDAPEAQSLEVVVALAAAAYRAAERRYAIAHAEIVRSVATTMGELPLEPEFDAAVILAEVESMPTAEISVARVARDSALLEFEYQSALLSHERRESMDRLTEMLGAAAASGLMGLFGADPPQPRR